MTFRYIQLSVLTLVFSIGAVRADSLCRMDDVFFAQDVQKLKDLAVTIVKPGKLTREHINAVVTTVDNRAYQVLLTEQLTNFKQKYPHQYTAVFNDIVASLQGIHTEVDRAKRYLTPGYRIHKVMRNIAYSMTGIMGSVYILRTLLPGIDTYTVSTCTRNENSFAILLNVHKYGSLHELGFQLGLISFFYLFASICAQSGKTTAQDARDLALHYQRAVEQLIKIVKDAASVVDDGCNVMGVR
jgi:hypothetical protein